MTIAAMAKCTHTRGDDCQSPAVSLLLKHSPEKKGLVIHMWGS